MEISSCEWIIANCNDEMFGLRKSIGWFIKLLKYLHENGFSM